MSQEPAKTSNELAAERTDLAVERSVMGANRTLMAWIRTALSLIGFGFTIYKVLLSAAKENLALVREGSPKRIGMFLIFLGTASIIMGTIEYFQTMKHLDRLSPRDYRPFNYATIIGIFVGLLGLFLLATMLLNREVL